MYIHDINKDQKTYDELKEVYPNSAIPVDGSLTILDYCYILGSTVPAYDANTQKLVELEPTKIEGKYYKAYQVVGLTQQEIDDLLATNVETAQNQFDVDCRAYILGYWSAPAQSNVSMGLYEQHICELCKEEISTVLTDNTQHIDALSSLTTQEELTSYMNGIVRPVIFGGN